MKTSKRQLEIEARRAADPIAQALGRTDIDYSTDALPTAPRSVVPIVSADFKCSCGFEISGILAHEYKFCPYCGKPKGE